jgi:hypothetical protein
LEKEHKSSWRSDYTPSEQKKFGRFMQVMAYIEHGIYFKGNKAGRRVSLVIVRQDVLEMLICMKLRHRNDEDGDRRSQIELVPSVVTALT